MAPPQNAALANQLWALIVTVVGGVIVLLTLSTRQYPLLALALAVLVVLALWQGTTLGLPKSIGIGIVVGIALYLGILIYSAAGREPEISTTQPVVAPSPVISSPAPISTRVNIGTLDAQRTKTKQSSSP